jgi:hypothetical protein
MAEWWSIEVFHGERERASAWKDSYGNALTEAAITNGAQEWAWIEHRYGVVFEVSFSSEEQWEAFRALPAVRAALDAVPDPVSGLIIYRGRGGSSGARKPKRPRPTAGAGAAELPEPEPDRILDLAGIGSGPGGPPGAGRRLCRTG